MKKLLPIAAALLACFSASAEYKGDFELGSTVTRVYDLYTTAGADVERTVAGTPSCVEDGGITQITAGVTDSGLSEFDSHVGLNLFTVVATAANGFEAGKDYDCGVRTATLNDVTATYRVVSFSVEARAPLKGSILERDTASTGSTTSLVNFDTAATIASTDEHITNLLVNVTQAWQRCITATTTGTPDTASIYPNSPAATADNDVLKIVTAPVPCYPIDLNGAQVEVVSVNGTALTAQAGENLNRAFDNDGQDIATSYLDVLAADAAAVAEAATPEDVATAAAAALNAETGDNFIAVPDGYITELTCDSGTTTTCEDAALNQADDFWRTGVQLKVMTGSNAGLRSCIVASDQSGTSVTVVPAFPSTIDTATVQLLAAPHCAGVDPDYVP